MPGISFCSAQIRIILAIALAAGFAASVSAGCNRRSSASVVTAHVTVDTTTRFQEITGWEVVDQAGQEEARSYPAFRDSLLDMAVNDLGITRIRLWLRSGFENNADIWQELRAGRRKEFNCSRFATVNDNADPFTINWGGFHFAQLDYTIQQLVKPLKQKVEARGERFYLNANYVAFMRKCPPGTPYHHTTAEEYAEFVLASYLYMRDKHGIVPDAWEVILEPDNTDYWRGRQIGEAIAAAAKRLEAHGFTPRFIAPSTTKAGNAPLYFDDMMKVPGVQPYIEELAYHRYGTTTAADIAAIAERGRRYHVKTGMLEHIGSGYRNLHQDLEAGQVSAWQQFALAYHSENDDGAQYYLIEKPHGRARFKLGSRTPFLRQYFRYIRPGAVRVAATSNHAAVDPLAFIGPAGKRVVVIKADSAARVQIQGMPPARYSSSFTTADEADVQQPVRTMNGVLQVAIPAAGVLTVFAD